jgi:hypothetical protein
LEPQASGDDINTLPECIQRSAGQFTAVRFHEIEWKDDAAQSQG